MNAETEKKRASVVKDNIVRFGEQLQLFGDSSTT
jgi:hypothetical protein